MTLNKDILQVQKRASQYQIYKFNDSELIKYFNNLKNNPNDWSKEVENPSYILDLLLSIINVSVQTVDIVNGLPKLEFDA